MSLDAVLEKLDAIKRHIDIGMRAESVDAEERTMVFRATSGAKARDGGMLNMDGMDAEAFEKNNQLLWRHGGAEVPNIGHVIERDRVKSDDPNKDAWDFTVRFLPEGTHELADTVFRIAQAGPIAMSIGFIVKKYRSLTDEERGELGLGPWDWVGDAWELLEASIVPVGSDRNAVKRVAEGDREFFARESYLMARAEMQEETSFFRRRDGSQDFAGGMETVAGSTVHVDQLPPGTAQTDGLGNVTIVGRADAPAPILPDDLAAHTEALRAHTCALEANTAAIEDLTESTRELRHAVVTEDDDIPRATDDTDGDETPDSVGADGERADLVAKLEGVLEGLKR